MIADLEDDIRGFVDSDWSEKHFLHEAYFENRFKSCSEAEWRHWISSGRSSLLTFIPLSQTEIPFWYRSELREVLRERGFEGELYFPYRKDNFVFRDWDFPESLWNHWRRLARDDKGFWAGLFRQILNQEKSYWSNATTATALQISRAGTERQIAQVHLSGWISKFRNLPCLSDTMGTYREPAELLRRTEGTKALLEVEPFVDATLDTEATRDLLTMLGVRDTPTSADGLMDRLRALARAETPPVLEVEKWYHRLDHLLVRYSTEEAEGVKETFANERIILTQRNSWECAADVFLTGDYEGFPEAPIVLGSVRHLALWLRIGVKDRPTAELAIRWLKDLPSCRNLSQDESRRVRSLLPRFPEQIWGECGHWLNLEGEWTPVERLAYALTSQSIDCWSHLFPSVKRQTADLRQISPEVHRQHPFSALPSLAANIEDRLQEQTLELGEVCQKPWLIALGDGLRRIVLKDQEETARVRTLATSLAATRWRTASGMETVPYVDGIPASTSRRVEVFWKDLSIYVENRPASKIAKVVPQEIAGLFPAPGRHKRNHALL